MEVKRRDSSLGSISAKNEKPIDYCASCKENRAYDTVDGKLYCSVCGRSKTLAASLAETKAYNNESISNLIHRFKPKTKTDKGYNFRFSKLQRIIMIVTALLLVIVVLSEGHLGAILGLSIASVFLTVAFASKSKPE